MFILIIKMKNSNGLSDGVEIANLVGKKFAIMIQLVLCPDRKLVDVFAVQDIPPVNTSVGRIVIPLFSQFLADVDHLRVAELLA